MIAGNQSKATKGDLLMRTKINTQPEFDSQPSNLQVTNEYFARYEAISQILDQNPAIVGFAHRDLEAALASSDEEGRDGSCRFSSDSILRILICQILEGETLRGTVIRVDDIADSAGRSQDPINRGCADAEELLPNHLVKLKVAMGGELAAFVFGAGQSSVPLNPYCHLQVNPVVPGALVGVALSSGGPGEGSAEVGGTVPIGMGPSDVYVQVLIRDTTSPIGMSSTKPMRIHIAP